jgi:hypothetical protein
MAEIDDAVSTASQEDAAEEPAIEEARCTTIWSCGTGTPRWSDPLCAGCGCTPAGRRPSNPTVAIIDSECEGCAKKLDPSGYDAGKQIKGRMRQSWSTRWIFAEGGYAGEEKMGLVLHPSCDYSHHAQLRRPVAKYLLMNPTSRWVLRL